MKNKNLVWSLIIISIISILIISFITKIEYNRYLKEYNKSIYSIVGVIKEKYPNISENEIIDLLNAEKNSINQGAELLKKYGIGNDDETIINLKNIYKQNLLLNIAIIFSMLLIIAICIILYSCHQNKELGKITKYIKEVNNKNYKLKIEDNTEDNLTNLRNELYKITLMLRETAENAEKDKQNLATSLSDISHQIKTPLTSISIMLDEIKENNNMDENTKQKFIFEISRQIEQITFLTIALLKLSKLDADAITFENKKTSIEKIINEVIRNLEIPIEIKKQNVIVDIEESYIIVDERWIIEAITNILKNCIEHSGEEKNIYITVKNTNLFIELTIKDEGKGIDQEDLKHIFERFYKGKNSSEDSYGIGLCLAKAIIEKQNGTIYCTSKLNQGTTFKIKWRK